MLVLLLSISMLRVCFTPPKAMVDGAGALQWYFVAIMVMVEPHRGSTMSATAPLHHLVLEH